MSLNCKKAIKHTAHHRLELLASRSCGCFKCLKIFSPDEVKEWSDHGKTAVCPYCHTNTVIGDASKYPINNQFLMTLQHNLA
jgi:NAD-dependent SIR2 family protein deacetylase